MGTQPRISGRGEASRTYLYQICPMGIDDVDDGGQSFENTSDDDDTNVDDSDEQRGE